ncbi:uncharacterized protein EAE98_008163 [Botrytis deweyae]|uniref:HNH nuclease domain-containing protein n=1 Tax=Botrytis deweyae TaxID=2478750 RepID=A0ABQ7IEX9_9HELO|nr:uncharacterized protein EAE98_008163 [Botrytis deweyae]KAF7921952.1 hypothetical protein EAE98_008163 [Botrytis deweyae]
MMSDSDICKFKVAGLVEIELKKPYNRDGNIRKSHALCIDGLTTPHKPLLMLSEKYIASHPPGRKELYDRPIRHLQMEAYSTLLRYNDEKPLSTYHRATIHINLARCFEDCLDEKSGSQDNILNLIKYHFECAHGWATAVIDQRQLDVTSEECVPFNDIINAANDIKDSLYARKLYMDALDEDNMVDVASGLRNPTLPLEVVDDNVSEHNQNSEAPDSQSSEQVADIGAQDDLDGSDTSTVRGTDDTVNNFDSDFDELGYEDIIAKARQNPTIAVEPAPIDVTDVRMMYGFMHFLVHDKLGICNLMNGYLDRMDAALELGEPETKIIRDAMTALNVRDNGNGLAVPPSSSPSTPSAPFFPIASTLPIRTRSNNTERESRKKRKFADDDEEDEML